MLALEAVRKLFSRIKTLRKNKQKKATKPQIKIIRGLVALKNYKGLSRLDNQHRISIGVELIFLLDRFGISLFHEIMSCKGRNHHH